MQFKLALLCLLLFGIVKTDTSVKCDEYLYCRNDYQCCPSTIYIFTCCPVDLYCCKDGLKCCEKPEPSTIMVLENPMDEISSELIS